ncbi:diol dehydratase reactivase subunit alpha [Cellulosilyticum sp. I15G10I2]|uniref:diol dehydratase reactivase subunit alpha n=1 Tax=Cellulosilyticum sp. I15G10I2 TaxID=1892843 RepID=UPI00085CBC97|nr:diol dehydratase reactivase subunit alpha [Cellulosilyticum sp. I15G10I2]
MRKRVAGIDIGNSTTEVCIAEIDRAGNITFKSSSSVTTTGTKGTLENIRGIKEALKVALDKIGMKLSEIDRIFLNEAAPVIGDTAMETITETIITDSTMIGHDPSTPSGEGVGIGETILITDIQSASRDKAYIVIVPKEIKYEAAAKLMNDSDRCIAGAIVQNDEAVLIQNRIKIFIPIVDEVKYIERIQIGMPAAIEVAGTGRSVQSLSNPYSIANIFKLTHEETKRIIPIAKSLIGNRSAVVVRTPHGEVKEKVLPAGKLTFVDGNGSQQEINIDQGAAKIMEGLTGMTQIVNIKGDTGSNVGYMLERMRHDLMILSKSTMQSISIKDLLAVDVLVPINVKGALAGEVSLEKAVAIAAMVKTDKLPMQVLAKAVYENLGIPAEVAGVEAVMASLGALTTRGSTLPLAILDLGGGSTDAAIVLEDGSVRAVHLAGAGNFITMLIDVQLDLHNMSLAEDIKRYPLAKVESLFHIRLETGEVKFFNEPLSPKVFGKVVVCKENELIPIETKHNLEKIALTRKTAKKEVFVQNALRALGQVAVAHDIRSISNVVLVGGSALDFEIPHMILEAFSYYNIVVGKGEIRGTEGPRNAVATGLVLSKVGKVW